MGLKLGALLAAFTLAMTTACPAHALYEGLQCVPYARQVSGISIYGDAYTWWDQAAGRYARGSVPRRGAVLAFIPHGAMRLGHVAAVSRVVDDRTILVRHANWSLIDGMRGHIEDDVRVIDVSTANDWSRVRVWYAPLADLGTTEWPTHGFIYSGGGDRFAPTMQLANSKPARAPRRLLFDRSLLAGLDRAAQRERRADSAPHLAYAKVAPTTDVLATSARRSRQLAMAR